MSLNWGRDADLDHMSEKPGMFDDWTSYDWSVAIILGLLGWLAVFTLLWMFS